MKQIQSDIIIIGAGLTGLTLAYYLKKKGKSVTLLEKNHSAGGVIQTLKVGDFVYECGPNTGVLGNPELVQLFDDLQADCKLVTANPTAKRRFILKNAKWQALPSGPISAISTNLFTFSDKLRVFGEPFRKAGTNPYESVADLVKRRLGKSILDYAVNPFVSGVYAGNPEKLITKFALPKLYNLEQTYGSFIRGTMKKAKEPKSELEKRATKEVFSADGGLQNLIHALTKSITDRNILLNTKDIKVSKSDSGFKTSFLHENNFVEISSAKVITTIGAYALPEVLDFIPKAEFESISNLEYAKIIQVSLGYKTWKGVELQAFGGLIPAVENRSILGVLFPSSLFAGRAPQGGALLSVFMGGVLNPQLFDMSDEEVKALVLKEIAYLMQTSETPDMLKIFRYKNAIPQYTISSETRFAKISELEQKYEGLILAGNIRNGIGMADRVKQAVEIANSIA